MTLDMTVHLTFPAFELRSLDVGSIVIYMHSSSWLDISSTFILIEKTLV